MEGNLNALPKSVIVLIPGRLSLGPVPTKRNKLNVHAMVTRHNYTLFVNCMSDAERRMYYWREPVKPKLQHDPDEWERMQPHERAYLERRYRNAKEVCERSAGIAFPMARDAVPKDAKLFKFVCSLVSRLKSDPQLCLYVYDGSGAHAAGLIALCVWYFMQPQKEKESGFDPVLEMRRRGKHHVVPEREKTHVQAIRRMCERDLHSIHPHLFFGASGKPPQKKRPKTQEKSV